MYNNHCYLLLPVDSTATLIEAKMALVVNQLCNTKVGLGPDGSLGHCKVHAFSLLDQPQEVSDESIKGEVAVCKLALLEENVGLEDGCFDGGGERVPALSEGWLIVLTPRHLEGLTCVGTSKGEYIVTELQHVHTYI